MKIFVTGVGGQLGHDVVNNAAELLSPLHMDRSLVLSAAPYFRRASSSSGNEGVQIDLLLQAKMSYCIVEVKRKASIGRDVIDEVERKRRLLPYMHDEVPGPKRRRYLQQGFFTRYTGGTQSCGLY